MDKKWLFLGGSILAGLLMGGLFGYLLEGGLGLGLPVFLACLSVGIWHFSRYGTFLALGAGISIFVASLGPEGPVVALMFAAVWFGTLALVAASQEGWFSSSQEKEMTWSQQQKIKKLLSKISPGNCLEKLDQALEIFAAPTQASGRLEESFMLILNVLGRTYWQEDFTDLTPRVFLQACMQLLQEAENPKEIERRKKEVADRKSGNFHPRTPLVSLREKEERL